VIQVTDYVNFISMGKTLKNTVNSFDANKIRDRKKDVIDSDNDDEQIIFSSEDESEQLGVISQNKNVDIQNILDKFVNIKLESMKKPKEIKKDVEVKQICENINSVSDSIFKEKKQLNENSGKPNKVKTKDEVRQESKVEKNESPLPFLLRMKQFNKNASIYKN
jgi:hypothetical protein